VWYEIIGIVGDQHQLSPTLPARAEAFENRRHGWVAAKLMVLLAKLTRMPSNCPGP
jgi:hypothetical protein